MTCQGMRISLVIPFFCPLASPLFLISQPRCAIRGNSKENDADNHPYYPRKLSTFLLCIMILFFVVRCHATLLCSAERKDTYESITRSIRNAYILGLTYGDPYIRCVI